MTTYREISPAPHLAPFVECFWTREIAKDHRTRILPDGCADVIIFTRRTELIKAEVVGVMTRPHMVSLNAGESVLGIRFHPGMAAACLPVSMSTLNDKVVPLQTIWGSQSSDLIRGIGTQASTERKIAILEERLASLPTITQVQRAIGELVDKKGQLAVDDFAAVAGVGERQLRRTCLKYSGLAPKHLARILRFRSAITRLREGDCNMALLALDCGYCDQAHMIRDFQELAGISPGHFLREQRR